MGEKPLAWITVANGLIGNYVVQSAPKFASRWRVRALEWVHNNRRNSSGVSPASRAIAPIV